MEALRNKYKGQILNIVGKGPSLRFLKKDHFVPGPIVTINQAILAVEPFGFEDLYSMQKDGGSRKIDKGQWVLSSDCDYSDDCGYRCGAIIRPEKATLLVHDKESLYCFNDYSPRVVLDWLTLGLPGNENSMIFSIQLGKFFGCSGFRFISFDAHTSGDCATYVPGETEMKISGYNSQIEKIPGHINGFDSEWITPKKEQE